MICKQLFAFDQLGSKQMLKTDDNQQTTRANPPYGHYSKKEISRLPSGLMSHIHILSIQPLNQ
ncbi:hypothetical protein [Spirosoma harenae]